MKKGAWHDDTNDEGMYSVKSSMDGLYQVKLDLLGGVIAIVKLNRGSLKILRHRKAKKGE